MLKHTKRQVNEFLFSKMHFIVMFVTAVCVLFPFKHFARLIMRKRRKFVRMIRYVFFNGIKFFIHPFFSFSFSNLSSKCKQFFLCSKRSLSCASDPLSRTKETCTKATIAAFSAASLTLSLNKELALNDREQLETL